MIYRKFLIILLAFFATLCQAQEQDLSKTQKEEKEASKFKYQGDSRRTFVDNNSVGISGIRGGYQWAPRFEAGIGIYSSNLFGILGSSVSKDYEDTRTSTPSAIFPAEIGFHYGSIYGEYTIIENKRLIFTANSQVGLGWVDIEFEENANKDRIREGKSLIEHSIKADVLTLKWLRLIGGVGYRYLTFGEQQLKDAFNAPIYIVGFSIDFKTLFKKKNKNSN